MNIGYSSDPHHCSRYYSHRSASYAEEKFNQGILGFFISSVAGNFFSLIYVMNISISDPLAWMVFIYKPVADMVNAWLS